MTLLCCLLPGPSLSLLYFLWQESEVVFSLAGWHLCCGAVGPDLWASFPSLAGGAAPPPQGPGAYLSRLTGWSAAALYLSIRNPAFWACDSFLIPGSLPVVPCVCLPVNLSWISLLGTSALNLDYSFRLLPPLTLGGLLDYNCPINKNALTWTVY